MTAELENDDSLSAGYNLIFSIPSICSLKKIVFSFPKEDWGGGVKEKISNVPGVGGLMLRLEFEIEIVKLLLVLFYRWWK